VSGSRIAPVCDTATPACAAEADRLTPLCDPVDGGFVVVVVVDGLEVVVDVVDVDEVVGVGAGGAAATVAVTAESASVDPPPLVAVTATRIVSPTSAERNV